MNWPVYHQCPFMTERGKWEMSKHFEFRREKMWACGVMDRRSLRRLSYAVTQDGRYCWWDKEQVDCRLAYSGGVSIVLPALFKEQQAGVVTKSSYTGAIHPAEAQFTPEACSLSLSYIHTHGDVGVMLTAVRVPAQESPPTYPHIIKRSPRWHCW